MKYTKLLAMATIALSVSLVGCSDSGSSTPNSDQSSMPADQSDTPTDQSSTPADQSDASTDQTSMPAPDAGDSNNSPASTGDAALNGTWKSVCTEIGGGYEVSTVVIDGAVAVDTYATYSDSTCTTRDDEPDEVITFSLEFPQGTVATSLGTARFIDITPESFTVGGQPVAAPNGFNTLYDIYLVVGDTLYLGDDEDDAITPEARPTQLDVSDPLTRQ